MTPKRQAELLGNQEACGAPKRPCSVCVDFAQLEWDCLNFMIMGDMVDDYSALFRDDVIECTEYRDVTEEPLLLPEGQNV